MWDYPGSGPDDLTFAQDQVILVRDANENEDWWFGTLEASKKTGYFPRNYVQLKPEGMKCTHKEKRLISYTNSTFLIAVPELNIKAKALYDFEGPAGQGCLDLKMGESITILVKENDDWWRARSEDGSREGLVPANYLEQI